MDKLKLKYLRKVPIMKMVFGMALFCVGILGALTNSVFNIVLSGIGIFLMLKEGSEINLVSKKYREIYSVMGFDMGRWKDLPDVEYVSVFKVMENKRVQGMGASANFSNHVYVLNLFYNRNQKIEAYRTKDIKDAFKNAETLAKTLNIKILDATERDSKWI